MAILKIANLSKNFSGLNVLHQISLEIRAGEFHAVIGPNGAGKSTLFNVITGLYKPSEGRIWFNAQDITGLPVHKIARLGLSRSFQIMSIFPKMTLYENIQNAVISKYNQRLNWTSFLHNSKEIRKETERIISMFNMGPIQDEPAATLSYGLQRELELALALVPNPVLMLLDEPTAGMDIEETRRIVEVIQRVAKGLTLLIVEHDMDVVFALASRITVLVRGEVLCTGSPEEIRQSEAVRKAYLGRK